MEDRESESAVVWIPFVTGAGLPTSTGKQVRLWGQVEAGSGAEFKLKTTDNLEITAKLLVAGPPRQAGWVEAIGSWQGRGFAVKELIPLPPDLTADLDQTAHSALANLIANLDDPWNLGEDEVVVH